MIIVNNLLMLCFIVQCQRVKNYENCLKRGETRVVLMVFNSVLYHVHPCTVTVSYHHCMNQVSEKLYSGQ
jgi:hypothetical protein